MHCSVFVDNKLIRGDVSDVIDEHKHNISSKQ